MGLEHFEVIAVLAVLIIVAASYFSSRLGLATPIILVLVGLGVSLVPGVPLIAPEPDLILAAVLPPLLYSAAVNMPVMDFRRDLKTIGALSVLLVLVSAFAVGILLWAILPNLSFAAAVAVGAVVSPPDAVAATAIGKRLGLPPRLLTILEGEGLVNDATALVLLRTAVAATAGAFSFWQAAGDFFYAVAVAIVIGAAVGVLAVRIRSKIDQPVLTTAISFVVPFIAFLPAELADASGVLSVVAAGLVTGASSVRRLSVADRNAERTNWLTIQLLLENGVFLLMGLQLHTLVAEVSAGGLSVWHAVWVGLAVTVLLGLIRVAFVAPVVFTARRRRPEHEQQARRFDDALERITQDERLQTHPRGERIERWLQRRRADAKFYAGNGLGWRGGAVLAWSGMRGVVTLAAAQSLPTDFPYRTQLVLIAFVVALVTLVGQGGTLPLLIRVLGIRGTDEEQSRRELALLMLEINEAAAGQVLDNPDLHRRGGERFDPAVIEKAREVQRRLADPRRTDRAEDQVKAQYSELMQLILDAQQDALNEARSTGAYDSTTVKRAQKQLDQGSVRFTQR
ncbi:sodium:proton antiporter [Brachybacterium sp.]|uniref:cation:proton antiporter n=1 Tax=Brachybacterium sp. TaxID=1891286 RepID=UPI002ED1AA89